MYPHRLATAAAVSAALLAGCSQHPAPAPPADPGTTSSAMATISQRATLPVPEELASVLYRLADPAVPGAQRADLIEGAPAAAAENLDRFTAALKDSAYLPLTFDVADVGWSDRNPGNVAAHVKVTTRKPDVGEFTFPMEFSPRDDGWRLARQTAELLLAFGTAGTGAGPSVASTP